MPARDDFDIGAGVQQSSDEMACAVNHLDPQTRAEIIARLLAGITAMGLRPRMIAQHGTIEKFMKVAGRELAARGSTRFD